MKTNSHILLRSGWAPLKKRKFSLLGAEQAPLRSELFTAYQMEEYGKSLALTHKLSDERIPDHLLMRLGENEKIIRDTCSLMLEAVESSRQITPAGEWLLDNFYLIEEQIRTARKHLPKGYSRGLPILQNGKQAGLPRVYELALEIISHSDAHIDPEGLTRFLTAYQNVSPLKLGELWAIPIMLRIALIENLRRVAARLSTNRTNNDLANYWADKMTAAMDKDPSGLILEIADMARSNLPMDGSFIAELARRLQGHGPALALPLNWMEQRLSQSGTTIEQVVYTEIQQQAADQVSISNSIGSLRLLGTMNWRKFVEALSIVEHILQHDPIHAYSQMDFATRDRYRHAIENIAKNCNISETEVAQEALALARLNTVDEYGDRRTNHIGYFLIDEGLRQLEKAVNIPLSFIKKVKRGLGRHPFNLYFGSILILTSLICVFLSMEAYRDGFQGGKSYAFAFVCFIGASHLSVAIINWAATLLAKPHPLPRMDFSSGIPPESRTLIVIPTMLTSRKTVDSLIEGLEIRYLANRDNFIHFALLTDFTDAAQEVMPDDADLLDYMESKINELNRRYHNEYEDNFFLLHRRRIWNAQEKIWMGHERKRGKLADLNDFLRGGAENIFLKIAGRAEILQNVKYVITLDTDTQLPREAAAQMISTMAHPLNRGHFDEIKGRVTKGYGIIQPRIAVSLPGTDASLYAQFSGGEPGIDPYTRAVSDVYQDAFHEGSFIGKGIYDVDVFERALKGKFPDNKILSHDLLEGSYARSGLLSDVQLYEEYPSRYSADVARRHRWIRGDWQILGWLFTNVKNQSGETYKNPLSGLSRWKIFDNLRRSIVPVAFLLILVSGWTILNAPKFWSFAVIGILIIPSLNASLLDLGRKAKEVTLKQHLAFCFHSACRHLANAGFIFISIPYEAYYSADAILRSIWRMTISHKLMLEWNPSTEAAKTSRDDLAGTFIKMWVAPVFSAACFIGLSLYYKSSLNVAAPVLSLWFISPFIIWKLSEPQRPYEVTLDKKQTAFLRKLARKTWGYFETYVGVKDNWLAPDNVQEQPVAVIAHRTSPTNIGLSLLANLTAYDFGFIPMGEMIRRTDNTFKSLSKLERYRGHFFNWYDTLSMEPLNPRYVSTVDSGNLAGHLLTLKSAFSGLSRNKIFDKSLIGGLQDTLRIISELADSESQDILNSLKDSLKAIHDSKKVTLLEIKTCLDEIIRKSNALVGQNADKEDDLGLWSRLFGRQCLLIQDEMTALAPWLSIPGSDKILEHITQLNDIPTLAELSKYETLLPDIEKYFEFNNDVQEKDFLDTVRLLLPEVSNRAARRVNAIERLMAKAEEMSVLDYSFLYDKENFLFSIGYNVSDQRRDQSYYDLLASEVRLGIFVAIAQGEVPQQSWFALGRQLVSAGGDPTLLSWSGSMFEYLMPLLVMPTYPKTLLDQTYKAAVRRQIEYGEQNNVPWGVSESGYNMFDTSLNYQYKAFGVPRLGIKRGLGEDLVIAPYASAMSLMVMPKEAASNLKKLSKDGYEGKFGHFEAIDFTASRMQRGKNKAVIQSFMVHHLGMAFLAFSYHLLGKPMQKRFAEEPLVQSALLLLHEKIPKAVAPYSKSSEWVSGKATDTSHHEASIRVFDTPNTPIPEVHLLSNGRYLTVFSNAGSGFTRWKDLAVTRWREDGTRDNWGNFCYIRDLSNGNFWSTGYQPTLKQPKDYQVIFSEGRAEIRRRDDDFEMHSEIVVSPEDDIELRRTRIKNRSRLRKTIDVTSYAEIVLAPPAADLAHPAFSNLFVQTEIFHKRHAILATRRPRAAAEKPPWMFHQMSVHGARAGKISYETDRLKFIGRGRTLVSPKVMVSEGPLSDSQGSVLDPVASIRYQIVIEPGQSVTVDIVTGAAETREHCENMVDRYQDSHMADRVFELAWTHSHVILRQLNIVEADAQLFGRLAGSILYSNAALRADPSILARNRKGQSGLWSFSISGDLPIILVQIKDSANIDLIRRLVQAHAYWRLKGLAVDMVIWNEDHAGYRQSLQDQIVGLISAGMEANVMDKPGGIFVRSGDQLSPEDRVLFQSVARVILNDDSPLEEQIARLAIREPRIPRIEIKSNVAVNTDSADAVQTKDLILYNGMGGFSSDGKEYVIKTSPGKRTPAPWSNVIANPFFGTVISESGQSYTWFENAHGFRLTPWNNDPVGDTSGEAFYLRDEETGHYWSPVPLPGKNSGTYATRHGFGYSVFEHTENGIKSELWIYVSVESPVKFSVLKVKNISGKTRRLSATGYVEWVLGDLRSKTNMHIVTEIDPKTGAVFAHNAYNTEFSERIAFFDVDDNTRTVTSDRREFLGRNGSLQKPSAMERVKLSGKNGAGLDACTAIQVPFDLADGQEREITFRLGIGGRRIPEASAFVKRFRGQFAAKTALQAVKSFWNESLGAVQIETPEPSLNILANGWLMYQTIACRMWARSGYYQSGGAFGFRDQLQDTMSLLYNKPGLMRDQLLLCAAHQFVDGDVQHWWHPPSDRGVRTKCSDDYLWLPLATARYVSGTGDVGVLEEKINFIDGRPLGPNEDSYYDAPSRSAEQASLYEHCVRAIKRTSYGSHGLPLIGSCDWNDGMDKVGEHGKGESVWLGFFLYDILLKFEKIALQQNDVIFAQTCVTDAARLRENIEAHAWDGGWYRRAYFDDGTPLGSSENTDCQIDSLSQSWSVLSGAGDSERSKKAMEALDQRLVKRDAGLIQLLDPPFDKSDLNPGYIRGYVPGVRENGGQYTHAAIWAAMAFAKIGDRKRAFELLQMINPLNHARNPDEVALYKVEPYVVAADVYGVVPHIGRGGWTWYTGSSGWLYRLIIESILGLKLEIDRLSFDPCLPEGWNEFKMEYRYRTTNYSIKIETSQSASIILDGVVQADNEIRLVDDQQKHEAIVKIIQKVTFS